MAYSFQSHFEIPCTNGKECDKSHGGNGKIESDSLL